MHLVIEREAEAFIMVSHSLPGLKAKHRNQAARQFTVMFITMAQQIHLDCGHCHKTQWSR